MDHRAPKVAITLAFVLVAGFAATVAGTPPASETMHVTENGTPTGDYYNFTEEVEYFWDNETRTLTPLGVGPSGGYVEIDAYLRGQTSQNTVPSDPDACNADFCIDWFYAVVTHESVFVKITWFQDCAGQEQFTGDDTSWNTPVGLRSAVNKISQCGNEGWAQGQVFVDGQLEGSDITQY